MSFAQIAKDKRFFNEDLKARKEFVESFRADHGILPSIEEFNVQFLDKGNSYRIVNEQTQDYVIEVWRGEWFESYSSESNSYQNQGSAIIHLVQGLILLLIGVLPLALFHYFSRRDKEN